MTQKSKGNNLVNRSGRVGVSDVTGGPQVPDEVGHATLDQLLRQLGPVKNKL